MYLGRYFLRRGTIMSQITRFAPNLPDGVTRNNFADRTSLSNRCICILPYLRARMYPLQISHNQARRKNYLFVRSSALIYSVSIPGRLHNCSWRCRLSKAVHVRRRPSAVGFSLRWSRELVVVVRKDDLQCWWIDWSDEGEDLRVWVFVFFCESYRLHLQ